MSCNLVSCNLSQKGTQTFIASGSLHAALQPHLPIGSLLWAFPSKFAQSRAKVGSEHSFLALLCGLQVSASCFRCAMYKPTVLHRHHHSSLFSRFPSGFAQAVIQHPCCALFWGIGCKTQNTFASLSSHYFSAPSLLSSELTIPLEISFLWPWGTLNLFYTFLNRFLYPHSLTSRCTSSQLQTPSALCISQPHSWPLWLWTLPFDLSKVQSWACKGSSQVSSLSLHCPTTLFCLCLCSRSRGRGCIQCCAILKILQKWEQET